MSEKEIKTVHGCGDNCSCSIDGCQWVESDERECYETGCGRDFKSQKGIVEENGMLYCPFCRGEIFTTWHLL